MFRARSLVGATALAAASVVFAAPAHAAVEVSEPLAEGLSGPLQVDANDSAVFVSQSFGGPVVRHAVGGGNSTLLRREQGSMTGVAFRDGQLAYTFAGGTEDAPQTLLKVRNSDNTVATLANLGRFERRNNPDAGNRYGVLNPGRDCAIPRSDRRRGGIVESNPYAVSPAPDGGWYVADAAANTVLEVSSTGAIDVVSVLKPLRTTITRGLKRELGLPRCAVGKTYAFEPVPTDVQRADSGKLFVSLLPGGPESANGAGGRLVRINPDNGKVATFAKNLAGATNVAVAPGRVFVTQLFGGKVTQVDLATRTKRPFVSLTLPAALDWHEGTLYVTDQALLPNSEDPNGGPPNQGRLVAVTETVN